MKMKLKLRLKRNSSSFQTLLNENEIPLINVCSPVLLFHVNRVIFNDFFEEAKTRGKNKILLNHNIKEIRLFPKSTKRQKRQLFIRTQEGIV